MIVTIFIVPFKYTSQTGGNIKVWMTLNLTDKLKENNQ